MTDARPNAYESEWPSRLGEVSSSHAVDISVIIANYNAQALLERCLRSIYAHPPARSFEVLVVDDGSSDGSAEMVAARFPQVRLLINGRNLGYARSNNRAILESKGRLLYLLNSDAELLPGALDALAGFLEAHPDAGAAGSLLYNADGSIQASVKALPSAKSALFGARSFLSKWLSGSRFIRGELLHWKAHDGEPYRAGYVSSASLMIPRAVVREVGPLDTRLWYFIDADYCTRVWNLGRGVYCVPAAKAIHLDHQGGTKADLGRRFRAIVTFHYGAYIYFRKHAGKAWWHPQHALVGLGLGGRCLVSILWQVLKEIAGSDRKVYTRR